MLSVISPYFSFTDSRFGIQKSKENTARVSIFRDLGNVPCVFTLECSMGGQDFGKAKGFHFNREMLERLGKDFCRTLLVYKHIYLASSMRAKFRLPD